MRRFVQLLVHEFQMSLRRPGLWVAYGSLFLFHTVVLFAPPPLGEMVPGEAISRGLALAALVLLDRYLALRERRA